MPISYKTIIKGTPGVAGGGEQKYYASIVRGRKIDLRTFVEEIATELAGNHYRNERFSCHPPNPDSHRDATKGGGDAERL